jgi:hypothetical protein
MRLARVGAIQLAHADQLSLGSPASRPPFSRAIGLIEKVKRDCLPQFVAAVSGQGLAVSRFGHGRQIGQWEAGGSSPSQFAHSPPMKDSGGSRAGGRVSSCGTGRYSAAVAPNAARKGHTDARLIANNSVLHCGQRAIGDSFYRSLSARTQEPFKVFHRSKLLQNPAEVLRRDQEKVSRATPDASGQPTYYTRLPKISRSCSRYCKYRGVSELGPYRICVCFELGGENRSGPQATLWPASRPSPPRRHRQGCVSARR